MIKGGNWISDDTGANPTISGPENTHVGSFPRSLVIIGTKSLYQVTDEY